MGFWHLGPGNIVGCQSHAPYNTWVGWLVLGRWEKPPRWFHEVATELFAVVLGGLEVGLVPLGAWAWAAMRGERSTRSGCGNTLVREPLVPLRIWQLGQPPLCPPIEEYIHQPTSS